MTDWWDQILALRVLDPTVLGVTAAIAALVVFALLRRRVPQWPVAATIALAGGALVGMIALWAVQGPLGLLPALMPGAQIWAIVGFAAVGLALANLWRSRTRRKAGALLAIPVLVAATALAINAAYGLNPTLATMLGRTAGPALDLPRAAPTPSASSPTATPTGPLWQSWSPPAGMPDKGKVGTVDIPPTASGFKARKASVYLPPAAQVADPPALPVVVFLMGQPGTPDPSAIASVLDRIATDNRGLAPIAVVADQLGDINTDSLCLDTALYGKSQTYINVDVVAWVKATLRVSPKRSDWTIAGYSHGGQCASSFVARYPQVWGNALSISQEEFPGSEHEAQTLREVFKGDKAAYAAARPAALLAKAAPLTDTWTIFTVCLDDPLHVPGIRRVHTAAKAAGALSTIHEFPTGGHGGEALVQGLRAGLTQLQARTGLAKG